MSFVEEKYRITSTPSVTRMTLNAIPECKLSSGINQGGKLDFNKNKTGPVKSW